MSFFDWFMVAVDSMRAGAQEAHIADESKKCPYCAEMIKAEAVKCRYCGSDLTN